MSMPNLIAVVGSGAAVSLLALYLMRPANLEASASLIEERRRDRLRRRSFVYREFACLVQWAADRVQRLMPAKVQSLGSALKTLQEDDWQPEEFLAVRLFELVPALAIVGALMTFVSGPQAGAGLTVVLLIAAPTLVVRAAVQNAHRRTRAVRSRLPFTLDLMALTLEAGGGTLHQCLRLAAEENRGHALGEELTRALHAVGRNVRVVDAFGDWSTRYSDPDITEVADTICSAEERGSPLKECLRGLAARLRIMQTQWVEKASEEAKVHITWPTMLAMVACLVMIVAPILIGAMSTKY